jgi:hypothetical protein
LWVVDQHGFEKTAAAFPEAAATLKPIAEFWGSVPFEAMPTLYHETAASGGCVISTSSAEGLGLGLLEAQACGCPVIAPEVDGVVEAVSSKHGGVLFPFGVAPSELASVVIDTLRDEDRQAGRRSLGVSFVRQHFGRAQMASRYLQLYAAPPAPRGRALERLRVRARLSPLVDWRTYLDCRWGVGREQFDTMEALAGRGEWRLAAAAGRESLRTSPTMYFRPGRVAQLLSAQLHGAKA